MSAAHTGYPDERPPLEEDGEAAHTRDLEEPRQRALTEPPKSNRAGRRIPSAPSGDGATTCLLLLRRSFPRSSRLDLLPLLRRDYNAGAGAAAVEAQEILSSDRWERGDVVL